MRLPNGYGTVAKLSGARRRPYIVKITKGFNDRGHPITSIVGYCVSKEEGLILLAQYNNKPWDVAKKKLTFEELFKMLKDKEQLKFGKDNWGNIQSAYKCHCKPLYKVQYSEITAGDMQDAIDKCGKGYSTQANIKTLFFHMDRYAKKNGISIEKYSDLVTIEQKKESIKMPFTFAETDKIWAIKDEPWADAVLILLYTGFRLQAILNLKAEDIDLETGVITGGVKTESGKSRKVPIHSKIFDIVKKRVECSDKYLFTNRNGGQITKSGFYPHWNAIMKKCNLKHTAHECRHTFRSRLDSAGANKKCIDLLMGHKSKDVGERVYTHKTMEELKAAIELLA